MKRILFFDTETTGVPRDYQAPITKSHNWPRLVQLGWIVIDCNGKMIKERNCIIRPEGFRVPQDAIKVHGITNQKALREGHYLEFVLDEFMEDLQGVERIVGHNINFDKNIIGAELYRIGKPHTLLFDLPYTCTMHSSTNYCKIPSNHYGYKWPSLEELHIKLFGYAFEGAHDAMSDIIVTKKCYLKLIQLGIITDYPYFNNGWFEKYSYNLSSEEQAMVAKAQVIDSEFGHNCCFFMKDGTTIYTPMSTDSTHNSIGDLLDLTTLEVVVLEKEGETDIERIRG